MLALLFAATPSGSNELEQAFLDKRALESDVTVLESGLMYKVLEKGSGFEHPMAGTDVTVDYEGRTATKYSENPTGKNVFDSSYERGQPGQFKPAWLIKGWGEALQLMVEGDKWELYIPAHLGYGKEGSGAQIEPDTVLVFNLKLLKLSGEVVASSRVAVPYTDFTGAPEEAQLPPVIAVLKKPLTADNKMFEAFKEAARNLVNKDEWAAPGDMGFTAVSEKVDGKYTTDPLAERLGFKGPAVYAYNGYEWTLCKTGRTPALEPGALAIANCVRQAFATRHHLEQEKAEVAKEGEGEGEASAEEASAEAKEEL